jgi:DNA ligase-1
MYQDFKTLREFVNEMNSSNSTTHKVEILKKYNNSDFIKNVLLYTYHPYKQYGITSTNLKKRSDLISSIEAYDNIFYLLDDLNDRNITGHSAVSAANSFIQKNIEFADLIYQIIDRNLETRATTTLINRVFPNLIPIFSVALAHDVNKVKNINLTDGTWRLSRKLDGVRCLTVIRDGVIKFFSRNGKEFHTLSVIKYEILDLGITNCVLDGEICMMTEDGSDDFQGILKEIQRKDHTIVNPRYWVFDILTLEEFDNAIGETKLMDRLSRQYFDSHVIMKLPQSLVLNEEQLLKLKENSKNNNWEGLIGRRDVGYEGDRTRNMVKLKDFYDSEYEVIDLIMEPQRVIVEEREVEENMLSSVIIEHKGNRVRVGSGFTISERRKYYETPSEILGNMITVQYFEETVDMHGNNSLRFPVFKANHGKKRTI